MKTKLLAAAALVVFSVGAPVASLAADVDLSKARQLVVEPKGADVVAVNDQGQAPVLAVEPKGVDVADVNKLVIDPQPAPITPKIAIEPEGADITEDNRVSTLPIVVQPEATQPDVPEVKITFPSKPIEPRPVPKTIIAESEPVAPAIEPEAEAPEAPAVAEEAAPEAVTPPKAAETTVATPDDLYALLTGKGYKVDVLKRDGYGRLVFQVTPADGEYAYLLLVDEYGKVLTKRAVSIATSYDAPSYDKPDYEEPSYASNYSEPAYNGYEAPSYQAEAYGENCGSTAHYGY